MMKITADQLITLSRNASKGFLDLKMEAFPEMAPKPADLGDCKRYPTIIPTADKKTNICPIKRTVATLFSMHSHKSFPENNSFFSIAKR
jgi:hypothetical protein